MTEKDRAHLEEYLVDLLEAMQLYSWRVILSRIPEADGSYAHISPTFGCKSAVLSVCDDFREVATEKARCVLVHELLHCHAAGVQHHVQDDRFCRLLGEAAYSAFRVGFDQHHENQIDAVANVLAPFMPELKWPE